MVIKTIIGAILLLLSSIIGCNEEASTSAHFEWFLYNKNDSTSISTAMDVEFSVKSKINYLINNADIIETGIIRACIVFASSSNEIENDNPEFTVSVYDTTNILKWDTTLTWHEADFSIKPIPGKNYSNLLSELKFYIDW